MLYFNHSHNFCPQAWTTAVLVWYAALAFLHKSFHENKWPIKMPQFFNSGIVSLCVTLLNNHSDICLVLCLLTCWLIGSRLNNSMLARLRRGPMLIVFVFFTLKYSFTNRWAATGPSNLWENNCHKVNFIAGFMHLWAGRRCPVPRLLMDGPATLAGMRIRGEVVVHGKPNRTQVSWAAKLWKRSAQIKKIIVGRIWGNFLIVYMF